MPSNIKKAVKKCKTLLEEGEFEVEAIIDKGRLTPEERKKHNVNYTVLYCVKFLNYEE